MSDSSPARTEASEAEMIRKAAAGQDEAVRALVDQHLGPITHFAFRMLGDQAESEDVAQEAFLRLWKELPDWEPRAKVTTWLHRVAHNLCIDRLRSLKRERLGDEPEPPDPSAGAAAMLEDHQRSHAMAQAIASLPDRQRAAIALVYHQGLSNREAASVLGLEVDGLESLLSRGRANLRRLLAPGASDRRSDERPEPLP